MLLFLAPTHSHLLHWVGFLWLSLGRDKTKLVERGAGAGRHVGEAANLLVVYSEQACNRAASGGGWPAARPVWPLGPQVLGALTSCA